MNVPTVIVVTAPRTVEVGSDPDPSRWSAPLAPGEVAGPTVCTLVSPGTEIAGAFSPGPHRPARYPVVPGYAAVFRVDEVGAEVSGIRIGDLVFSHGGHRSRQRASASAVTPLPPGLDPFSAVFTRLMLVPMATLATTAARPGERVGVSGLGPIGFLAASIFAASGFDVTAWDPRPERRVGLPDAVRVLAEAPPETARSQYGTTDGFALVLECSGHDGAALAAVRRVRSGGEVALVGTPWQRRTDATAHELLDEVFHRYAVLRSGWEWQVPAEPAPFGGPSARSNTDLALRRLADGTVAVDHLAWRARPDEAQSVYDALADGTAPALTALFDWR